MALFVIACMDHPNALDLRLATRAQHLEFLSVANGIRTGGPFLDEAGAMIGSMLIIEAESLEHAQAFAARDPYARAGLFAQTMVREWKQTVGSSTVQPARDITSQ
jgi:uncharacterized protein